jgi:hypothetical protein
MRQNQRYDDRQAIVALNHQLNCAHTCSIR